MQQGQWSYAPLPLLMEPQNRYYVAMQKLAGSERQFRHLRISPWLRSTCRRPNSPEPTPPRGALLRLLDTLAAWQMRHSHSVISRVQADSATITGVTQPSSANERSSTSPCDR